HHGADGRVRAAATARCEGGGAAGEGLGTVHRAAASRSSGRGGPAGARGRGAARNVPATPGAARRSAVLCAGASFQERAADVRLAVPADRGRGRGASCAGGSVLSTQRLPRG